MRKDDPYVVMGSCALNESRTSMHPGNGRDNGQPKPVACPLP